MAYGNESSSAMPDRKLLDTCVSAFELAIREIRKIENGDNAENPNEPVIINESALAVMKTELSRYAEALYTRGFRDGRENFRHTANTIADETELAISEIIKKAIFSDRRNLRDGEGGQL